ncbi:MAG: hypothetical protein AB7Y46_06365 [Armatimonadota bacterium]
MRRALFVLCMLATGAALAHAAHTSPAAVACPRIAQAPTIDGLLGPDEWSAAAAAGPFALEGGGMPALTTRAWIGFDDDAVYVGAHLHDPLPLSVQCLATERDGAVRADDSFTLVLDPGNDGSGVMELALNATGTVFDAVDGDATASVTWSAAAHLADDGWVVEIAYPFGPPGPPAPGAIWGVNLRRHAPRVAERSSMTGDAGRGIVAFGPALRCEVEPIDSPWYGGNTLAATLVNLAPAAQTLKVNVRVTGPTRRAHFFETRKLTLGAGETRELPVTYQVQRGGRCAVELSVQAIEGTEAITALRTAPMLFELPPLGEELDRALSQIAAAYKTWALMPAAARPFDGASRLDMLLARWRYLDSQHQRRASLTPDVVLALFSRARALTQDAILLDQELKRAAGQG